MRRTLLAAAVAAALAACGRDLAERGPVDPRFAEKVAAVQLDPGATLSAVNAYRQSRGLPAVRLDAELTAMAQHQADGMAAKGELSHNAAGPFQKRLGEAGVVAEESGENLGAGYYTLNAAMDGWRGSAEHNANLLRPGFTRIGVAIAKNPRSDWGVFWAMEFASEPALRLAQ